MNLRVLRPAVIGLTAMLISTACTFKATPSPAEEMATNIARGVSVALTSNRRSANAYTVSHSHHNTHPCHAYPNKPTEPATRGCEFGRLLVWPGPAYNMESSITQGESVELLGVGSVPGWYIIRNPYFFQPCWIQAINLRIDASTDISLYPVITPYPLRTPSPGRTPKP